MLARQPELITIDNIPLLRYTRAMQEKAKAPQVSIIVPVYNVEGYLRRCLNSIWQQTLEAWECICVDDGSPDSELRA